MERLISFFGLFLMMFIAWLLSSNRKKLDYRVIGGGLLLQFLLALFILKTEVGVIIFNYAQDMAILLVNFSDSGAKFLFGDNFTEHFFAFKVLPTIIFISSVSYVLFYLGVLQKIVQGLAWLMARVMNISGAESLVTAANVFVGQTEAPLFVSHYIKSMTRSEIMAMMTGGMATVAGGVLAAYVGFGISAGHLLAASIMSAPAAIVIAKIMTPETESSPTKGSVTLSLSIQEINVFEAACKGAAEGLKLALNVGAMLLAFLALLEMINYGFSVVGGWFGVELTLQTILGWVFRPLAWAMGISWQDSYIVGQMLGTKMVLNEFVAYLQLAEYVKPDGNVAQPLSERSITIATYALCGFANFSSVAVQIGGIGNLEPSKKREFASLGVKAMIGGTLAAFMTACIAGILL